jgi:hypothetical protein
MTRSTALLLRNKKQFLFVRPLLFGNYRCNAAPHCGELRFRRSVSHIIPVSQVVIVAPLLSSSLARVCWFVTDAERRRKMKQE